MSAKIAETSKTHRASLRKLASVAFPPLAEQARIVAEVERRLRVIEELEAVMRISKE